MKQCSYCGHENPDEQVYCREGGTEFEHPGEPPVTERERSEQRPKHQCADLPAQERQNDWVTLVKCPTLVEADLVVCRLQAAGINAFLPDKYLMQAVGWNFNTFGYVRVQVSLKDFYAARDLLSEHDQDA